MESESQESPKKRRNDLGRKKKKNEKKNYRRPPSKDKCTSKDGEEHSKGSKKLKSVGVAYGHRGR
jgi:hypothetical protein